MRGTPHAPRGVAVHRRALSLVSEDKKKSDRSRSRGRPKTNDRGRSRGRLALMAIRDQQPPAQSVYDLASSAVHLVASPRPTQSHDAALKQPEVQSAFLPTSSEHSPPSPPSSAVGTSLP